MEANEAQELQEHAEHGAHESSMRPVAFTMSVLAVLVAVTTVLGHRTHTEAVLNQNKATDQWNFYQAHKIRDNDTELTADLLGIVSVTNPAAPPGSPSPTPTTAQVGPGSQAGTRSGRGARSQGREGRGQGRPLRPRRGAARNRPGDHLGHVAHAPRVYWYLGIVFSIGGIVSAASVLLLH